MNIGIKEDDARGYAYFSCIGRWTDKEGCDYTSGGLICISPITIKVDDVETVNVFEFAETENKVPHRKCL